MKKLDKLLLKSYIGPLVLTFFIALFVLDMMFLWKYVDDMIGKGIETFVLLKLLFYASATSVPMAFPLAILVASIMTFGNYGEHFELTAVKSSGISLFRFMRPLIVFSIMMAGVAFYFSNNVLPVANLEFRSLLYDIRQQKPALDFQPGIFNNDIEGFSVKMDSKSEDEQSIYDVIVYDHTENVGNNHVIIADSARLSHNDDGSELILMLYNGKQYKEEANLFDKNVPEEHFRTNFDTWEKHFDLSSFQLSRTDKDNFSGMHQMLNIKQLYIEMDTVLQQAEREKQIMKDNLTNYFISEKEKKDTLDLFVLPVIDSVNFYTQFDADIDLAKYSAIGNGMVKARNVKNIAEGKMEILSYKHEDLVQYKIHIHQKFSLSAACIVLFFIGAPLGAIIKKGGFGWPMLGAVLFFVVYIVTSIIGEKTTEQLVLAPWQGVWLSTLILSPIGIFLTYKAKNDSQIFSVDFYKRILTTFSPSEFKQLAKDEDKK
ncbi:MAG: LptF/LptG family permease [Chitinophagales bacterium]